MSNPAPVVIAIDRQCTAFIDHLKLLPIRSDNHIIHFSPTIQLSGTTVNRNYDILVTIDTVTSEISKDRLVVLPRPPKSVMAAQINESIIKHDLKMISPIPTFSSGLFTNSRDEKFNSGLLEQGKYVIKPEHGARGIHQYVVDTSNTCIVSFLTDLLSTEAIDLSRFPNVKGGVEGHPKTTEREKEINLSNDQGVVIQELIPDIHEEIRVLFWKDVTGSLNLKEYPREFYTVNGYRQASGSECKLTQEELETYNDKFRQSKLYHELVILINSLDLSLGSLDVGINKESAFIFEYSNQFGCKNMNNDHFKIHKDFLDYLIISAERANSTLKSSID